MTVEELIDKLKEYQPDAPVVVLASRSRLSVRETVSVRAVNYNEWPGLIPEIDLSNIDFY